MGGVLTLVLKPREVQCPVVRSVARELVTCLVIQPVMDFASPAYINEIIELLVLALKEDGTKVFGFTRELMLLTTMTFLALLRLKMVKLNIHPAILVLMQW